jgi:adenosylhomocysteine nucleosidase
VTLVLGAMEGEIAEALSSLRDVETTQWHGYRVHLGRVEDREVCVARTGVGKSLSAMLCQHLIDVYAPDQILFSGVAGALNPSLEVGDTVIARDCMIHDMDATAVGFKRGEIPYTPYRVIPCDTRLVARASALTPLSGSVLVGRILTGDQFVSSVETRDELRGTLDGDAAEMEGASVGLVAAVNQIPFLLIRTISDKADGQTPVDLKAFLTFASRNSWHYFRSIVVNG